MADKLMYISVDNNSWLKRLDTQLNKLANQNSCKVPKVVKPMNKERYYITLGTSVLSIPMSSHSLKENTIFIILN